MDAPARTTTTLVPEYPVHPRAAGLVELLPEDARRMFREAGNCAFRVRPAAGDGWEWCFAGVQRAEHHPRYISVCCRSRGAWDEAQEVLCDTASGGYVVSARAFAAAFAPETIVMQAASLDAALNPPAVRHMAKSGS